MNVCTEPKEISDQIQDKNHVIVHYLVMGQFISVFFVVDGDRFYMTNGNFTTNSLVFRMI